MHTPRWLPQVRLVICGWLMGWLHFYFNKTMSRYSELTEVGSIEGRFVGLKLGALVGIADGIGVGLDVGVEEG